MPDAYESTLTAAARWGLTTRRVRVVCSQGRVPGCVKVGRDWLLPAGSEQPGDRRRKAAVQQHEASQGQQDDQPDGEVWHEQQAAEVG